MASLSEMGWEPQEIELMTRISPEERKRLLDALDRVVVPEPEEDDMQGNLIKRAEAVKFRVTPVPRDMFRVDGPQFHALLDQANLVKVIEMNEEGADNA